MSRQSRKLFILLTAFLFAAGAMPAAVPVEASLNSMPEPDDRIPGVDGMVSSLAFDDDYIYVGGKFKGLQYSIVTAQNVVQLDASTGAVEKAVYLSSNDVNIHDIVSDGSGGWYVSGVIDDYPYLTEGLAHILPNGTRDPDWNPKDEWGNSQLVIGGGYLYVTGYQKMERFNLETGKLDTSWEVSLPGYYDPNDMALSSDGKSIFLINSFGSADLHGLRKVDIASVSLVNGWAPTFIYKENYSNIVDSMAIADGKIFFSGVFAGVDGQARNGLAAVYEDSGDLVQNWDPSSSDYQISAVAADTQGHVYVGYLTYIDEKVNYYLRRFHTADGSLDNWAPVCDGSAIKMIVYDNALYVAYGSSMRRFNLDEGPQTAVWNLHVNNRDGVFAVDHQKIQLSGNRVEQLVRNLVRLDRITGKFDPSWAPIPLEDNSGEVDILKIDGDDLYVAGIFRSSIGGQPNTVLAKLDKDTGLADPNWHPVPDWIVTKNMMIVGDWVYLAGDFDKIGDVNRPWLARVNKIDGEVDDWTPAIASTDGVEFAVSDGKYLYVTGYLPGLSQDKNVTNILARYDLTAEKPVLDLAWGTPHFYGRVVPSRDNYIYALDNPTEFTRFKKIKAEKDNWNPSVDRVFNIWPTSRWAYVSAYFNNSQLNVVRMDTQTHTSNGEYLDPIFQISKRDWQYQIQVMAVDGAEVYVGDEGDYICGPTFKSHCGVARYIVDPPAPLALDALNLTGTGFTASWEPVHGVDQYVVELTTEADNFAPNTFIAADGTPHQAQGVTVSGWKSHSLAFSGLDPNTTYVYRLQASNAAGSSDRPNVIRQSPSLYNTRVSLDVVPSYTRQGKFVTLSATVSTTGDLPGGTVTFKIGTDIVGTSEVNTDGKAFLYTGSLPVGQNLITAEYDGGAGFLPSISDPVLQIVVKWLYRYLPQMAK